MADKHVFWRAVEMRGQEARALIALQPAQHARAVPDKVCEPVFDVRWVGARSQQVQLDHITALHQAPVDVGHISREGRIELAHRADPVQAGDRIEFVGDAGRADAAQHFGHGQDEDLLWGHVPPPLDRQGVCLL